MGEVEKKIRFDRLTGAHILWASTMGASFDLGIMSKAMLIPSMRTASQRLILYQMRKGVFPFINKDKLSREVFRLAFDSCLNDFMGFAGKYEVLWIGGSVVLKIDRDSCMYCPTGVGGSQLGLAVCPYPQLFSVYLDVVLKNGGFDMMVGMIKEADGSYMAKDGDWDVIRFDVKHDECFGQIRGILSESVSKIRGKVEGINGLDDLVKEHLQFVVKETLEMRRELVFVAVADKKGNTVVRDEKLKRPAVEEFDRQMGLAALSSGRGVLVQPYPREAGVLIYDVSTPIYVDGELWGALRIGYRNQAFVRSC